MLPVDKVIHHARLQWPRTEQGNQGDHILQGVRLQATDQVFHATGFKLEHRCGFRLLEHVERWHVVQRNLINVQSRPALPLQTRVNHLQGPVDDGQGPQPQEVKLHQAGVFHIALVELGHQAAALVITVQRREIGNLGGCNHHAAGVLTGVSTHTLKFQGHLPDFLGFLVIFQELDELWFLLQRLLQGHARLEGNHLGEFVRQPVRLALNPGNVPHNRLGSHGAEGNDLGHRLAAVFFRHVGDNTITAFHAEVDVEVGHRNPFGVQEALEQQVVFQRIKIGNQLGVSHQGASTGTPARAYRHAVILGPLDEVHNDQEVPREPHLDNDIQLEVQALVVGLALGIVFGVVLAEGFRQPLFQSLFRHLSEVVIHGHAIGNGVVRQEILSHTHRDRAAPGNFYRVLDRLGDIREKLNHFIGAAQILLVAETTLPPRVVQGAALANAHPCLMGFEIFGMEEVDIVCRHHRATQRLRQFNIQVQTVFIPRSTRALQLQVERLGVEVHPVFGTLSGKVQLARHQCFAHIPQSRSRQGNQPFSTAFQPLALDNWLTETLPLCVPQRDHFGQVQVAIVVAGQQSDAKRIVRLVGIFDPQVSADNGLHPSAHGRLVETYQGAHVGLLRKPDSGHTQFCNTTDQGFHAHQAIYHGVFGMHAEVDKGL